MLIDITYTFNRWKNGNNIFLRPGIELGPLDSKFCTLPRRYKIRLYRKAVQVYHIPIPGDIYN